MESLRGCYRNRRKAAIGKDCGGSDEAERLINELADEERGRERDEAMTALAHRAALSEALRLLEGPQKAWTRHDIRRAMTLDLVAVHVPDLHLHQVELRGAADVTM